MTGWALFALLAAVDAAGAPATPTADAPTVTARVDRAEARVGDILRLTITAISARATPVNLPAALALGKFTELERREEEQDLGGGKRQRRFVLGVAAYETGEVVIPPVEVTYLGKRGEVLAVRTEPVPVKIVSLIANEPDPALKENAPPVPVMEPNRLLFYAAGGVLAALFGALLALWLRRRMRARAAVRPPPPPRPADDIALERLDRLGASLGEADDLRPYYFEVSEVVREYLGARYGFDALEMTTEEVCETLARRGGRGLVLGEVAGWLGGCDLVKFAKSAPTIAEARGALETAIRIVESTRPRPEPQGAPLPKESAHG